MLRPRRTDTAAFSRRSRTSFFAGSVVGYLLWFRLLTMFGATAASTYHFLMPPLGILFGWILLGEHVGARDLIGVLPVAVGIYLVTRPGHKRR
jgi:drug/metabolite transporter (DMT)-like permease